MVLVGRVFLFLPCSRVQPRPSLPRRQYSVAGMVTTFLSRATDARKRKLLTMPMSHFPFSLAPVRGKRKVWLMAGASGAGEQHSSVDRQSPTSDRSTVDDECCSTIVGFSRRHVVDNWPPEKLQSFPGTCFSSVGNIVPGGRGTHAQKMKLFLGCVSSSVASVLATQASRSDTIRSSVGECVWMVLAWTTIAGGRTWWAIVSFLWAYRPSSPQKRKKWEKKCGTRSHRRSCPIHFFPDFFLSNGQGLCRPRPSGRLTVGRERKGRRD